MYRYISLGWPQIYARWAIVFSERGWYWKKEEATSRAEASGRTARTLFRSPRVNYVRLIESTTDDLYRIVLPLFSSGLFLGVEAPEPFCSRRRRLSTFVLPDGPNFSRNTIPPKFLKNRLSTPDVPILDIASNWAHRKRTPTLVLSVVQRTRFLFKTPSP